MDRFARHVVERENGDGKQLGCAGGQQLLEAIVAEAVIAALKKLAQLVGDPLVIGRFEPVLESVPGAVVEGMAQGVPGAHVGAGEGLGEGVAMVGEVVLERAPGRGPNVRGDVADDGTGGAAQDLAQAEKSELAQRLLPGGLDARLFAIHAIIIL